MDRIGDFGSSDVGSNPTRGTFLIKIVLKNSLKIVKFYFFYSLV
jgi:hypothetical protein